MKVILIDWKFPANICWSWRRLQDISWRLLQQVYSTTVFRLSRRLEDILKTSRKMSWKTKNCYAQDVLKTSWRHILKTSWRHVLKTSWRHSWRHLQDFLETKKWGYLHLKDLNVYVSSKSIFHKSISGESKANPKSLIKTQ